MAYELPLARFHYAGDAWPHTKIDLIATSCSPPMRTPASITILFPLLRILATPRSNLITENRALRQQLATLKSNNPDHTSQTRTASSGPPRLGTTLQTP